MLPVGLASGVMSSGAFSMENASPAWPSADGVPAKAPSAAAEAVVSVTLVVDALCLLL